MITIYHRLILWLSLKATNYKLRFQIRVYCPLAFRIRKAWMIAVFSIQKNWLLWRIRRARKRLGLSATSNPT